MNTMSIEQIEHLMKEHKRIFVACEDSQSIMVTSVLHEDVHEYFDRITDYVIPDVNFCSICVFVNSSISELEVMEIAGSVAVEAVIAGKRKLFARYERVGAGDVSDEVGLYTFRINAGF